jgi:hypothetical protein
MAVRADVNTPRAPGRLEQPKGGKPPLGRRRRSERPRPARLVKVGSDRPAGQTSRALALGG